MKNRIARFFRLLRADAIEGFASIVRLMFISCALFVLLIGLLFLKADASGADYSKATFADFVLSIAGGSMIYDPASNMPFVLPVEWMLSMLLMLFIPLRFPYRNLMGIGKTLMVEAGERWSWWLSKCVWTVSYVLTYWGLMLLVSAVFSVIMSGSLGQMPSEELLLFSGIDSLDLAADVTSILPAICPAVSMSCALCLIQLVLSLMVRPIMSFACGASLLFTSAYFFDPLLVGNYLMLSRSSAFIAHGTDPILGCGIALVITVIAAVVGGFGFSHMDIMDKEFSS